VVEDGPEFLVEVRQPERADLFVMVRSSMVVGRECDGLILDDPKISRLHAELTIESGSLTVTDLGSTNGTVVNGQTVTAPTTIGPSDEIVLGTATIRIDPIWHARRTGPIVSKTTSTRGTVIQGSSEPGATIAGGAVEFAAVTAAAADSPVRRTSIDIVAEAVQSSGLPEVDELTNDEGTLTIVFSDIESSTEMAAAMGDASWMRVLAAHNDIIRRRVAEYGGRDIKSQGDGFMLSFPTGEVIKSDDGDLFGRHVIMAARIAGAATGGQILVSDLVRQITEGGGDLPFGESTSMHLKGLGDSEYAVYDVRWWDYPSDARA